MKDKQQKEEKAKVYDAPVTQLELHQELRLVKMEIKQEIKQEMSNFKEELTQGLQQEFSKFTTAVCQQIDGINNHLEDRFKENEQEHNKINQRVTFCETKLNI